MLLRDSGFSVPQLPGILIFKDDSNESSFYAVSGRPRVACASDGSPEFSLMLYGKRRHGVFEAAGGVLSFTVSLGLTREEEETLVAALANQMAEGGSDAPPPRVTLLGLHWSGGETTLSGASGISASTKPSLFGDNRSSFSLRLTAEQAKAAQEGNSQTCVQYDTQLGLDSTPMTFSAVLDFAAPDLAAKTSQVEM